MEMYTFLYFITLYFVSCKILKHSRWIKTILSPIHSDFLYERSPFVNLQSITAKVFHINFTDVNTNVKQIKNCLLV